MTTYQDIFQDLPCRVHRVWQQVANRTPPVGGEDLSVTAMLMAAAAGLAMPFENLKDIGIGNSKKWNTHPAFEKTNQTTYQIALKSCDDFLVRPIAQCNELKNCQLMQCQELRDIKKAAKAGQGDATLDISKHDVRFALKILRNALAHNNVVDIPDTSNQIEKLAFFSKSNWCSSCGRMDGWHVLVISVNDFKAFLNAWFALLNEPGSYAAAAAATAGRKIRATQPK